MTAHIVYTGVAYVYVLRAELLVQALTQRAHSRLARSECTSQDIASNAACRSREEERAALAPLVEVVLLELFDDMARECKRAFDGPVEHPPQAFICRLQEWPPDA